MSVLVVFALGVALVGSLCLLAHTIYQRPSTGIAAPSAKRNRFPIVGSEPSAARDAQAPDSFGEIDEAYRAWVQSLRTTDTVKPLATESPAR